MRFTLVLHLDNDAFQRPSPKAEAEVARILRETATRLLAGEDFTHYRTLFDANGNDVGRAAFKEES